MIAPQTVALFAVSDATIPSMIPVPNFSGCFDVFLAVEYAIRLLVPAPTPGRIPIKIPINADLIILMILEQNSFTVNPNPFIFVFLKSEDLTS